MFGNGLNTVSCLITALLTEVKSAKALATMPTRIMGSKSSTLFDRGVWFLARTGEGIN